MPSHALAAGSAITLRWNVIASLVALFGVTCIDGGALSAASIALPPVATGSWRLALDGRICRLVGLLALRGAPPMRIGSLLRDRHVSIASTSAVHNPAPIMIVSLERLACGIAPGTLTIAGLSSAIAGATLLSLHSGSLSDRALQGDLLALASAASLAIYYSAIAALLATNLLGAPSCVAHLPGMTPVMTGVRFCRTERAQG